MTAHLKTVASVPAAAVRPSALPEAILGPLVAAALAEDLGRAGDITAAATVPADATARVAMAARRDGVICGLGLAACPAGRQDSTTSTMPVQGAHVARPRGGGIQDPEGARFNSVTARVLFLLENRTVPRDLGHTSQGWKTDLFTEISPRMVKIKPVNTGTFMLSSTSTLLSPHGMSVEKMMPVLVKLGV
jgi:hypothetical protein